MHPAFSEGYVQEARTWYLAAKHIAEFKASKGDNESPDIENLATYRLPASVDIDDESIEAFCENVRQRIAGAGERVANPSTVAERIKLGLRTPSEALAAINQSPLPFYLTLEVREVFEKALAGNVEHFNPKSNQDEDASDEDGTKPSTPNRKGVMGLLKGFFGNRSQ